MLFDHVWTEMIVEGARIGPSEHLVLQQRVLDPLKEFAKTGEQIALGDEQIDGKPDIQGPLDQVQLLGQPTGLLGNGFGRVTDKTFNGEDQEQAVDGRSEEHTSELQSR